VSVRLRSLEFRREREASWRELAGLVETVEKRGVRALDAAQLARLPVLYRATLSSLSVARSISLDKNLLAYLEALAARAYFCVYGIQRPLRSAVAEFFRQRFPAVVRRYARQVALSSAVMVLGAVVGFALTMADSDRFYSFVDAGMASGRDPSASTTELRETLYHEETGPEVLTHFTSFLFTHNARIGILCFALGFAAGIPTLILLFQNGLLLGAFAALFHQRGLSVDLWGWLLPHGVTELGALVLCGAAGLVVGQSLLFPGTRGRLENLAERGREAGVLVLGAVAMLLLAGGIEGVFRQSVQSIEVRYAVVAATASFWTWYFSFVGRRPA
jgi:uncharacterized membrane protein SpoIIM required for sporulation